MYESLEKLPAMTRDKYGNLNLVGENAVNGGLRKRVEYLLALDGSAMAGVILCDLLDWFRWGSENSVMWECTLPELIQVIDKWLAANANTPVELFDAHFTKEVNWSELWNERGMKDKVRRKGKCSCGTIFTEYNECKVCWQRWYEMWPVYIGPRWEGTYDLVLLGAAGRSVAAAVWTHRGQPLVSPAVFEKRIGPPPNWR